MFGQRLLVLAGYLCGSICFAYVAGRLWKGIDLREYGSRKLSGSNVHGQIGVWAMIIVGLADVSKAVLPTWLGIRLGFDLSVAIMAGLAAMIGHNWPLFFGFRGGRGIGTALGTFLVVFPWGVVWILGSVALGRLTPRAAAVAALLGFVSLPFFAAVMGQPAATIWGCSGMLAVIILKRLEGNREPFPAGEKPWSVLWRRLWLDRDISDFDAWIHRTPDAEGA